MRVQHGKARPEFRYAHPGYLLIRLLAGALFRDVGGLRSEFELMERKRQIGDKLRAIRPRAA